MLAFWWERTWEMQVWRRKVWMEDFGAVMRLKGLDRGKSEPQKGRENTFGSSECKSCKVHYPAAIRWVQDEEAPLLWKLLQTRDNPGGQRPRGQKQLLTSHKQQEQPTVIRGISGT